MVSSTIDIGDKCSVACTQSGTVALLVSFVILSLVQIWSNVPYKEAQGNYIALRYTLAIALEELEQSDCWIKLKNKLPAAEQLTLMEISELRCTSEGPELRFIPNSQAINSFDSLMLIEANEYVSPAKSMHAHHELLQAAVPMPPQTLKVVTPSYELVQVLKLFTALNDGSMLTKARRGSFDISIYRWVLKRERIIKNRRARSSDKPDLYIYPDSVDDRPQGFVPTIPKETLLTYTTVADIKSLSGILLPQLDEKVRISDELGTQVQLSLSSLNTNLYAASLGLELFLLILLVYFSANLKAAQRDSEFPHSVVLFRVFSGWGIYSWSFTLILWVPSLSGIFLTIFAQSWTLGIVGFFVVVVSCLIQWQLIGAGFYGNLETYE